MYRYIGRTTEEMTRSRINFLNKLNFKTQIDSGRTHARGKQGSLMRPPIKEIPSD